MTSAVRASMAPLIDRVRRLCGDIVTAGNAPQFSDLAVQQVLDRYRNDVRYLELREEPTYQVAPLPTVWLDFYDDGRGDWETDAVLQRYDWTVLTPATSDWLTGHWTFASSVNPPVNITGKSYDVHLAAAALCETWASGLAQLYDFTADGATFRRSQQAEGLRSLAHSLRMKARPRMVSTGRSDYAGGRW
jgi:hypothetical protein